MEKTLVVTGASSGIGKRICELSGQYGFSKVVGVGRSAEGLAKTKSKVEDQGGEFLGVQVDLANGKNSIELIAKSLEGFSNKVDLVVNNAGVLHEKPIEEVSWDNWKESMTVNLAGPYFLTQAMLPFMRNAKNPVVVNISSTLAKKPIPNTSVYNIAKAGINMMTQTLALELAPKVRVNAVMPAVVNTPMYQKRFATTEEMKAAMPDIESIHPMGRIGSVDDIAKAVFFLSSNDAGWITGTVLPVDGGMLVT